jgi:exodeoxyribonuclease VIII
MEATLAHLGRINGMPHEQYLAVDALSNTGLKRLRRSPLHYRAPLISQAPMKEPSNAMFAGTLAHCALLEPEYFDARYPVGPEVNKNSRAWKDFVTANEGKQVISQLQRDVAHAQAVSLLRVPEVARMFGGISASEVSVFWRDGKTGALCKARPDRVLEIPGEGVILFDAKTTGDASRDAFAKTAGGLGYHLQARWYTRGWEAATGQNVLAVLFGVVESEFPYAAAAYVLDDIALDAADAEIEQLLALHARCEQAGSWPGYPQEVSAISLPLWSLAPRNAPALQGAIA